MILLEKTEHDFGEMYLHEYDFSPNTMFILFIIFFKFAYKPTGFVLLCIYLY